MITRLCIQRILIGVITLWAVGTLIFAVTELLPGDMASSILGQFATEEKLVLLREKLGLNRPIYERYYEWLVGIVAGDLGFSVATGYPVADVLGPRLLNTIYLATYTAIISIPLSIALGLIAAAYPGSTLDRMISATCVFSISVPSFVIAVILVLVLSIEMQWFPSAINRPRWSDLDRTLYQTFLPMITLMLSVLGYLARMTRAAVIDVLRMPFVEMSILKGGGKWYVILRHAFPNAVGPIISLVGLSLGYLVSGAAIVEVIFSYPGMGRLMIDSITLRDVTMVQACGVVFAGTYITLNIIADIIAIVLNPRVRYRS